MNKYLITGFSGFVSRYFLNLLEEKGESASVLGLDSQSPAFPSIGYKNIHCDFKLIDLLNAEQVQRVIYQYRPDYVVHLASFSSVSFSWQNPVASFQNNTNIFLNILEPLRVLNLKTKILSVGSSEEYGNVDSREVPLLEGHLLNPINPYAVARVSQEMLSKVYADGFGIDIVMTRSFNHVGPGQSETFVVSSFAKQFAEGLVRKERLLSIVVGNVDIIRDFLDVRDVVRAYDLLLQKGKRGNIYNVCSGRRVSISEILEILSEKLKMKYSIVVDPKLVRPNDNMIIVGSNKKIHEETSWTPQIPLELSISDIIDEKLERLLRNK